MPIVERKVHELYGDSSPDVEGLMLACAPDHGASAERKSRRDRALLVALGELSLRLVVASLQRSVLEDSEREAHQAAEELLEYIRAIERRGGSSSSL
eukprot:CAMPEP_0176255200 /NCGR_PEP_ID=MMETSP0121_2-20121125/36919_1 /TAXON_ID=160619 /ORGANISM="Kryptoperidinium foliaceum, Strain CCMP 1326" /LENGTH=96 /DNA_ID=CAMNT_0017595021 /DNA_START=11 /DNA_END=301 /DNA_ORIENTATION=-